MVGMQDLGGAGITCATSETAARAASGWTSACGGARREPGMEPGEVMTSESQERMLAIVTPRVVDDGAHGVRQVGGPGHGDRDGHRPAAGGSASATVPTARCWPTCPPPRWRRTRPLRPAAPGPGRARRAPRSRPPADPAADCRAASDPSWVFRQYDHQLCLNTVSAPGGDAALLRLTAPACRPPARGLASRTDANARWCRLDPRGGAALTWPRPA